MDAQQSTFSSDRAARSVSTRQLDITVLSGGPSAEREVSLASGQAVLQAMVRLGHRPTICDISPQDLSALDRSMDFVFVALHGAFGEDGEVQAELERRGLAYCGSGVAASRLAMDKVESKRRFLDAGVPTPAFVVFDDEDFEGMDGWPHLPAVVKPVASGSSVDTTIERTREGLAAAVARVVARYGEALVEAYIHGPELTVGILGDQALPVCQIKPAREFYDYQAKYVDDDTQYLFDIDLPETLLKEVQQLSLRAHAALGCAVFSRVDWMIDRETLRPFALEVNTIPGFTSHSLLPKAAARIGLDFDQLCQRIIELSLEIDRG